MVSKKDMQRTAPEDCQRTHYEELKELEEHRETEALVLVQKKHKLIKLEGERGIARTMQILEVRRTMCPWSAGHDRLTQKRQCRRLPEWRKRWTR